MIYEILLYLVSFIIGRQVVCPNGSKEYVVTLLVSIYILFKSKLLYFHFFNGNGFPRFKNMCVIQNLLKMLIILILFVCSYVEYMHVSTFFKKKQSHFLLFVDVYYTIFNYFLVKNDLLTKKMTALL